MKIHSKWSRITSAMLSVVLLLTILFTNMPTGVLRVSAADSDFARGSGTSGAPYIIETAAQLDNVRNYLGEEHSDKYFELGSDIDLTDYLADGGAGNEKWGTSGWQPIGDGINPFTGTFEGANYKITGLWIDRPLTSCVGLFGYASGEIKNLGVEIDDRNGGVNGNDYTGGLVGKQGGGSITDCYATGSVKGNYSCTGGLVGKSYGRIENCYATGSVTSSGSYSGGLVGNSYGNITSSYATGSVTGRDSYSGGLVGEQYGGIIKDCYATGSVNGKRQSNGGLVGSSPYGSIINSFATGDVLGEDYTGGLVGYKDSGDIENSYATGSVTGVRSTGGLVGVSNGSITNSYAAGSVTGNNNIGGLVGRNDVGSSITSSYFDMQTTGLENGVGNNPSASGVTGLTTVNMVASDTLTDAMSGLDDTIWSKRAATDNYCYYPELKAYYEGSDVQMAASEASTRLERLEITLNAGSLSASPITYGDKLSSSAITGEADATYGGQKINGTFAWSNGSVVPTVKNNGFSMTFTPANELYKSASFSTPVTVNKAVLTVTAENSSRMQGTENPDFSFRYSGFVNGEDESELIKKTTISTTADKNSPTGKYYIIVSGGEADNYEFSYINATLTVIADTAQLEDAIEQAENIDRGDYSENCWQDLQDALEIGNDTLNKDGVTQAEVYEATQILLDAIDALVHEYEFIFKFDTFTGASNVSGTVNAPYNKFVRLLIDGEEVDLSNYTITEGSTVITLSEEYLKTLKDGSYTIKVEFTDGSATTTLTINADKESSTSSDESSTSSDDKSSSKFGTAPSTGDSIIFSFNLLMAASLSLLIVFKKKSR